MDIAQGATGTWGGMFSTVERLGAAGEPGREFLQTLSGRMGSYARANLAGLTPISELGIEAAAAAPSVTVRGRGELSRRLQGLGRGNLAEAISNLPADVTVTGADVGGVGRLNTLTFSMEGMAEDVTVPVVGRRGIYRVGAPATRQGGRNLYVARRVADLETAHGALVAGSLETVAPKFFDLDEFVANTFTKYHSQVAAAGVQDDLSAFLRGTVESSTAWETSEYRPTRRGIMGTSRAARMRAKQQMLRLPQSGALASAMGFPTGREALIDPVLGAVQNQDVYGWMGRHGLVQAGSETAARNLVYERMTELGRLSYGSWKNPLSKAHTLLREWNKSYSTELPSNLASQYQWSPVTTTAFQREIGDKSHIMMNLQGVYESEVNLLRERLVAPEGGAARGIEDLLTGAGIRDPRMRAATQRGLTVLARMNEGIFAAAIPRGAEMVSSRGIIVDELNPALGDLRNLVGTEVPTGTAIGRDIFDDALKGSSYMSARDSRTIIRGAQAFRDPKTQTMRMALQLEERTGAWDAKFGTAALKGFNDPIDADAVTGMQRFLRYLRADKAHAAMYGNAPVLPLPSVGKTRGAVAGFALWSSIKKSQDLHVNLLSNLMTRHFAGMTSAARGQIVNKLAQHRVTVEQVTSGQWRAVINTSRLRGPGLTRLYRGLEGAVGGIYRGIYRTPERYFRHARGLTGAEFWGSRFQTASRQGLAGVRGMLSKQTRSMAGIMGLEASLHGITTHGLAWDTLEINLPHQAPVTIHEINILNRMGARKTARGLMRRRMFRGERASTMQFNQLNQAFGRTRGELLAGDISAAGATRMTLDDVTAIHKMNVARGTKLDLPNWRTLKRYQNNFVIDLTTAFAHMKGAAAEVRSRLGTQIIVPGTLTDLWGKPHTTPLGNVVSTEPFVEPLENMLRNVMRYYDTGDVTALTKASGDKATYLAKLSDTMNNLATGRKGMTPDVGAWSAGRAIFRDYRRQFGGLGEDFAKRVVGVPQAEFGRLVGKLTRETGRSFEQLVERGVIMQKGERYFLTGVSKRFPITSADPAFIFADETVRKGMALDEANRIVKRLDFDGDTVYAHIMMRRGEVKELLGMATDPSSIANRYYNEFLLQGQIFGGVSEDILEKYAGGRGAQFSEDVIDIMTQRAGKMLSLPEQVRAGGAELTAKAATVHIGRYSNLSKTLDFMTIQQGGNIRAQVMRQHMAERLQQMSIDFGREAGRIKGADATAIAGLIQKSMNLAAEGHISEANRVLRQIFEDIGMAEELMKEVGIAERAGLDVAAHGKVMSGLVENFYGGLDVSEMNQRMNYATAMLKKGLEGRNYEQQLASYFALTGLRGEAGAAGVLPYPSSGRAGARSQVSAWNRAQKMRQTGQHILGDVWKRFKGTPHAKAAATFAGGAAVMAAGIGLMKSPTEFKAPPPSNTGAARAAMRTPDTAMVGATGEAPIPGGRHGNIASRKGAKYSGRSGGVTLNERRYYYDQTNRVPNVTAYDEVPEGDAIASASEIESAMRRGMGGGNAQVTMINDPQARRYSRQEMDDKMREEMLR
jgi:hypothetical protein